MFGVPLVRRRMPTVALGSEVAAADVITEDDDNVWTWCSGAFSGGCRREHM